jgi:hypothetical protein
MKGDAADVRATRSPNAPALRIACRTPAAGAGGCSAPSPARWCQPSLLVADGHWQPDSITAKALALSELNKEMGVTVLLATRRGCPAAATRVQDERWKARPPREDATVDKSSQQHATVQLIHPAVLAGDNRRHHHPAWRSASPWSWPSS